MSFREFWEMEPEKLNAGVRLACEWGEGWLAPIHDRLGELYPELTRPELEHYDSTCRAAMRFGHEEVRAAWREADRNQERAFELWRTKVLERCPWISEENLSRIFSQGMYYAWKDGDV